MPKAKKKSAAPKKKPKPQPRRKAAAPKPASIPRNPTEGGKDLRTEFVRLVMRIGTNEARVLLERVEDVQTGAFKP